MSDAPPAPAPLKSSGARFAAAGDDGDGVARVLAFPPSNLGEGSGSLSVFGSPSRRKGDETSAIRSSSAFHVMGLGHAQHMVDGFKKEMKELRSELMHAFESQEPPQINILDLVEMRQQQGIMTKTMVTMGDAIKRINEVVVKNLTLNNKIYDHFTSVHLTSQEDLATAQADLAAAQGRFEEAKASAVERARLEGEQLGKHDALIKARADDRKARSAQSTEINNLRKTIKDQQSTIEKLRAECTSRAEGHPGKRMGQLLRGPIEYVEVEDDDDEDYKPPEAAPPVEAARPVKRAREPTGGPGAVIPRAGGYGGPGSGPGWQQASASSSSSSSCSCNNAAGKFCEICTPFHDDEEPEDKEVPGKKSKESK
jgi:hypothetical protein